MPREHAVVALDVGTTKVCVLIGEVEENQALNIVGVGSAPSRGMRKGVVVNIDEVAGSISEAIEQCVRISGYRIDSAWVGVSGAHVEGLNTAGVIAVSSTAQEIGPGDVQRARESARVQALGANREVLHVLPRGYTVDGHEGVRDPIGMSGHRLEVQIHIVTAATTAYHNLVRSVRRAGVDMEHAVLQQLAAAEAVLTSSEREVGVALVDIGGGTTDIAIFQDLGVAHTATLPVGGMHITNDLALGLRAPISLAEEVKIQYGSATAADFDSTDVVELKTYDNEEGEPVSRKLIAEIIESRVQEIFALIKREIDRAGYGRLLPAGIVLTGGTADLRDIRRAGREMLGMPVRIGRPSGVVGLTDSVTKPSYAAAVGLLLWARNDEFDQGVVVRGHTQNTSWRDGSGNKLGRWLKEFLP